MKNYFKSTVENTLKEVAKKYKDKYPKLSEKIDNIVNTKLDYINKSFDEKTNNMYNIIDIIFNIVTEISNNIENLINNEKNEESHLSKLKEFIDSVINKEKEEEEKKEEKIVHTQDDIDFLDIIEGRNIVNKFEPIKILNNNALYLGFPTFNSDTSRVKVTSTGIEFENGFVYDLTKVYEKFNLQNYFPQYHGMIFLTFLKK